MQPESKVRYMMIIIPIPVIVAYVFLMGMGCFFWSVMVFLIIHEMKRILKGEPIEEWNSQKDDFEQVDPKTHFIQGIPGAVLIFLLGLLFFPIGLCRVYRTHMRSSR